MELSQTLQNRIIDFLTSLPNIHDADSQRAFIYHAGLDPELQKQIPVGKPPSQFVPLLMSTLVSYGTLHDGRNTLSAVLETAQNYVGQDRKTYCDTLIYDVLYENLTALRKIYTTRIQPVVQFDLQQQLEQTQSALSKIERRFTTGESKISEFLSNPQTNMIHQIWQKLEPDLQDALALAYNQAWVVGCIR